MTSTLWRIVNRPWKESYNPVTKWTFKSGHWLLLDTSTLELQVKQSTKTMRLRFPSGAVFLIKYPDCVTDWEWIKSSFGENDSPPAKRLYVERFLKDIVSFGPYCNKKYVLNGKRLMQRDWVFLQNYITSTWKAQMGK